jgi:hypothetical protein
MVLAVMVHKHGVNCNMKFLNSVDMVENAIDNTNVLSYIIKMVLVMIKHCQKTYKAGHRKPA